MGNFTCCLSQTLTPTIRFIDSHGILQRLEAPIKAAELMIESPGHVVSPADILRRTRRVSAMRADEELQAGKLYVMLPAVRVNSKVFDEEMSRIVDVATCRNPRKRRGSRVFPGTVEVEKSVEDVEEKDTGFTGHRVISYRPWKPILETINEGL